MIASTPPPARVQVIAQEYSYTLSRGTVKAGPVIVELVNRGQDTHDLRMRRIGGTHVFVFPDVQPGHYVDRLLTIRRTGTYRLWCSIADHRERGMRATLRVVPRTTAAARPRVLPALSMFERWRALWSAWL